MSHDSEYKSLSDSEIKSFVHRIKQLIQRDCDSLGKHDLLLHYSSDGSYIGFDSQPLRMV